MYLTPQIPKDISIINGHVQTIRYTCMHACDIILLMNTLLKYEKV